MKKNDNLDIKKIFSTGAIFNKKALEDPENLKVLERIFGKGSNKGKKNTRK